MADAFDIAAFRAAFPQFTDPTFFPPTRLQAWRGMALSAVMESEVLTGSAFAGALDLMTAHLGTIFTRIAMAGASGGSAGRLSAAAIDKVHVQYKVPEYRSGWEAWLMQTPYGEQLWAILSMLSAGGFYFNGIPETQSFRKHGGYF